jgi:hypothetical protein
MGENVSQDIRPGDALHPDDAIGSGKPDKQAVTVWGEARAALPNPAAIAVSTKMVNRFVIVTALRPRSANHTKKLETAG